MGSLSGIEVGTCGGDSGSRCDASVKNQAARKGDVDLAARRGPGRAIGLRFPDLRQRSKT